MSPKLSNDNIYAAVRTIDITGSQQNTKQSGIWSTPSKEQPSSSIFHVSPSPNKFLQTPTRVRSTLGKTQ